MLPLQVGLKDEDRELLRDLAKTFASLGKKLNTNLAKFNELMEVYLSNKK